MRLISMVDDYIFNQAVLFTINALSQIGRIFLISGILAIAALVYMDRDKLPK